MFQATKQMPSLQSRGALKDRQQQILHPPEFGPKIGLVWINIIHLMMEVLIKNGFYCHIYIYTYIHTFLTICATGTNLAFGVEV